MNSGLMTSASVFAAAVTLCLGGAAANVKAQDVTRGPRNLEEFDAMFRELSNWGRWGADDERGTLNLITPTKSRQAAALVRSGITVSLAHNPMPEEAPDNPSTAFEHIMGRSLRSDTYRFDAPCTPLTSGRFEEGNSTADSSVAGSAPAGAHAVRARRRSAGEIPTGWQFCMGRDLLSACRRGQMRDQYRVASLPTIWTTSGYMLETGWATRPPNPLDPTTHRCPIRRVCREKASF